MSQSEAHDEALKLATDYISLERTLLSGGDFLKVCRALVAVSATAPQSGTEAMTALRYIELECRDRPEAVMQKIHKLAAAALWSGNNGSVT